MRRPEINSRCNKRAYFWGKNDVMYPSVIAAIKKLDTALKHRKGQLKADLYEKPDLTEPETADETEQEMNLN